jgi:hypothetical protein
MEAVGSSETLVNIYKTTLRHIPEDKTSFGTGVSRNVIQLCLVKRTTIKNSSPGQKTTEKLSIIFIFPELGTCVSKQLKKGQIHQITLFLIKRGFLVHQKAKSYREQEAFLWGGLVLLPVSECRERSVSGYCS